MGELEYRILLGLLLFGGLAQSGYYRKRAQQESGEIKRGEENPGLILARLLFGLPLFGGMLVYLLRPGWLAWAELGLPDWARWLGLGMLVAGLPLMRWVLQSIGANISETVLLKEKHQLVTDGPYRWVRHPLYSVGVMMFGGFGLAADSGWILGFMVAVLVLIRIVVIPREEAALEARFGEAYREMRGRTGALLPRF
jgi:protein-S-isoprenylcysteine O-methyltransferase Ste14